MDAFPIEIKPTKAARATAIAAHRAGSPPVTLRRHTKGVTGWADTGHITCRLYERAIAGFTIARSKSRYQSGFHRLLT